MGSKLIRLDCFGGESSGKLKCAISTGLADLFVGEGVVGRQLEICGSSGFSGPHDVDVWAWSGSSVCVDCVFSRMTVEVA